MRATFITTALENGAQLEACSSLIHGECRIDQAISVGWYDIALRDELAVSEEVRVSVGRRMNHASTSRLNPLPSLLPKGSTP
jgi:hypothetical protein